MGGHSECSRVGLLPAKQQPGPDQVITTLPRQPRDPVSGAIWYEGTEIELAAFNGLGKHVSTAIIVRHYFYSPDNRRAFPSLLYNSNSTTNWEVVGLVDPLWATIDPPWPHLFIPCMRSSYNPNYTRSIFVVIRSVLHIALDLDSTVT